MSDKINHEYSAGVIVFKRDRGKLKYLVIKSFTGVHGFPKGHIEAGESEKEAAIREVLEETGLRLEAPRYRGIVTFISDKFGTEYMHLFTDKNALGEPVSACDEGELAWVEKSRLGELRLWEGDMIFLRLLDTEERFFSLKLVYEGDALISHTLEFA